MPTIDTLAEGNLSKQASGRLVLETRGQGFTELTDAAARWLSGTGIRHGLMSVFCRHTSASLVLQENADPDVRRDLLTAFDRLAPRDAGYVHSQEGPDDMPAHIRAMLSGCSLCIPVLGGRMTLGTWQGLYLVEHRDRPHRRELIFTVIGG